MGYSARKAVVERKTRETNVRCSLVVDGTGLANVDSGVGFLDHMLTLLAFNAGFDLSLKAKGDLEVDEHHTVEDCAIALGSALKQALGNRAGINRFGFFVLPMDESLARVAIDLGGRPFCRMDAQFKRKKIGDMSTELFEDFFAAFANSAGACVHVKIEYGRNEHHKAEALFKALGRGLNMACEKQGQKGVPSTKGVL
ncbi:MAG: imidazoleglycerol-phosphate dehydratase HisB [Candidatus Micrarchaeia archaeon]|jgi:imidazoleglycerol-phosphate dehydratase